MWSFRFVDSCGDVKKTKLRVQYYIARRKCGQRVFRDVVEGDFLVHGTEINLPYVVSKSTI